MNDIQIDSPLILFNKRIYIDLNTNNLTLSNLITYNCSMFLTSGKLILQNYMVLNGTFTTFSNCVFQTSDTMEILLDGVGSYVTFDNCLIPENINIAPPDASITINGI